MNQRAALLEQARDLLAHAAALPFDVLTDEELCASIVASEEAGRLVDALRVASAGEFDDRSRHESATAGLSYRLGHRRSAHALEHLTRVSHAEATSRIRLGSALRARVTLSGEMLPACHPRVAEAVMAGEIGVDSATTIVHALSQAAAGGADPLSVDNAERALVDAARQESADLVAIAARVWREALDPDGAEPRDEALRARRSFTVGREINGMTRCRWDADPATAALIRAALAESLSPAATPRFLDEGDSALAEQPSASDDPGLSEHPGASLERGTSLKPRDPRSLQQRQSDIMAGLPTAGIRSAGLQPGELRPMAATTVVVGLSDLRNGSGVGWIDGVFEPVSMMTVREAICEGGYQPLIVDDNGAPLWLGRTRRLFSSAQRRAMGARDGGCVWEHCTAPPDRCHAHHVVEWEKGGATDIDNGVLLCPAHHHQLHASEFSLTMIDGIPHLLAPPWLDPERRPRRATRSRVRLAAWRETVCSYV